MRKKNITIKYLAKELGISAATVSRALNDHPGISEQTIERVKKLAKELKYKPDRLALQFKTKKTNTIGVIVPQIVHYFFSSIISGVENIANEKGYNVILVQSNENQEREINCVGTVLNQNVDGVLASISKTSTQFNHFQEIVSEGIPLVFFDRITKEVAADYVVLDDFMSAFSVVEHLIAQGCKRIVHLAAPQNLLIARNRRIGYVEALKKYKIPYNDELFILSDAFDSAFESISKLLGKNIEIDGIFAVNDMAAAGAMKAINKFGKKIPEDIAVFGFTDSLMSHVIGLSTVSQHGYEMGREACKILIKRIENQEDDNYERITKMIKSSLVIRASSARK